MNHSLKIDTSAQSFSEPFTENSTNPKLLLPYSLTPPCLQKGSVETLHRTNQTTVFPRIEAGPKIQAGPRIQAGGLT